MPAIFTFDLASTSEWFGMTVTDPVNEICMLGLLVSLVFIALSKEKDEDEMIDSIRRRSIARYFGRHADEIFQLKDND